MSLAERPRYRLRCATLLHGGPLAVRDFRLLSVGQYTSTVGDYCYAVALPWFVLSAHGGTVLLGTVLACYGVPRTVLIPIGGILADKFGPRSVMLLADTVRCVLVGCLALLAARQIVSLVLLCPIAALLGAGEGAFIPASYSIVPSLLRTEQLTAGNALATAMVQAGSLTGPVLGGLLVTTAGPASAFGVDAASFAVSALVLALVTARRTAVASSSTAAGAGYAGAAAGGQSVWSLLRSSRLLQVILGVCVAANLASGGTFDVALPALAQARYGASGYGVLVACLSGGSLLGTLAAARAGALRRPTIVAFSVFLVAAIVICLVPLPGLASAGAIVVGGYGMCIGFGNIVSMTLLQQWVPRQLLGRVMSLVMLAGIGSFPASVAVAGVLVRHLGPAPFFPVAGIVLAVTILAGLTQSEIRDFGARPRSQPARAGLAAQAAQPAQAAVIAGR